MRGMLWRLLKEDRKNAQHLKEMSDDGSSVRMVPQRTAAQGGTDGHGLAHHLPFVSRSLR